MNNPKTLSGDLPYHTQVEQMIRVDHAGEYGAQRIYAGQLAILKHSRAAPLLQHMAAQEKAHLERFSKLMVERRVRPTVLMPLWHVAGYALGAATALMGEKAAMACTVAVESVIDEHYAAQEKKLQPHDAALRETINDFRAEEQEHHDAALASGAEQAAFYPVLSAAIKCQTKLAIWLSARI